MFFATMNCSILACVKALMAVMSPFRHRLQTRLSWITTIFKHSPFRHEYFEDFLLVKTSLPSYFLRLLCLLIVVIITLRLRACCRCIFDCLPCNKVFNVARIEVIFCWQFRTPDIGCIHIIRLLLVSIFVTINTSGTLFSVYTVCD